MQEIIKEAKERIDLGDVVQGAGGAVQVKDLMFKYKLICIYFSSEWCSPCKEFTPILMELYSKARDIDTNGLEVIFASWDKEEAAYDRYRSTMPWPAYRWQDPKIKEIGDKLKVTGIPSLLLLRGDGTILEKDVSYEVYCQSTAAYTRWMTDYNNTTLSK